YWLVAPPSSLVERPCLLEADAFGRAIAAASFGDAVQGRGELRGSVRKDDLVFASAHFITFEGHRCEGLHGHNYRAHVTLEGQLDAESWWVFDFVTLKKIMRRLCDEIDHKVLLPLENPRLQVAETGESVTVA